MVHNVLTITVSIPPWYTVLTITLSLHGTQCISHQCFYPSMVHSVLTITLSLHGTQCISHHCFYPSVVHSVLTITLFVYPRYTTTKDNPQTVYALVLKWPSSQLVLGAPVPSAGTTVTLLGYKGPQFQWSAGGAGGMVITVPMLSVNDVPCLWAWVFKLTAVA